MATCCLNNLPLNGRPVIPEAVIAAFPDDPGGRLGATRFKGSCFLANIPVKGKMVAAQDVLKGFQNLGKPLECARFKAECAINGKYLNGELVPPEAVLPDFPIDPVGQLAALRFKESCCFLSMLVGGKKITTEEVALGYHSLGLTLELANFKGLCCLHDRRINGRLVTSEEVIEDFAAIGAKLEIAQFKQKCCLANRWFKGSKILPESVARQFPDTRLGRRSLARFKSECCLRGLEFYAKQVTPAEVVSDFTAAGDGQGLISFLIQCCLSGLRVDGQQITPEMVIEHEQAVVTLADLANFKEQCCLRGMRNNGQLITPQEVVDSYRLTRAPVSEARFRGECFLRGMQLGDRTQKAEEIVRAFPSDYPGQRSLARFKEECCLRGHLLFGQIVLPEEVMASFHAIGATMELARFQETCFVSGLHLYGQPVSPEAVARAYTAARGGRELLRFKERCCLMGVAINGQKVSPEALLDEYEQGGWLLDKAMFFSHLALNARTPHGVLLNNMHVLKGFRDAPGNTVNQQVKFLIQQLHAQSGKGYCDVLQKTFEQAWQIVHCAPTSTDQSAWLRCILMFMAMQYDLTLAGHPLTPEQVLGAIKALRESFRQTRLLFFFLAHCYQSGRTLNGQLLTRQQVVDCLEALPKGRLRTALACWFDPTTTEMEPLDALTHPVFPTMNHDLPDAVSADASRTWRRPKRVEVFIDDLYGGGPFPCRVTEYFDDNSAAHGLEKLSTLLRKALTIVQQIDGLWITGSFSRYLQGIGDTFNDIDLIGSGPAIQRLLEQLNTSLNSPDADIPSQALSRLIPGCFALRLPTTFDITLTEGELGSKVGTLQANVFTKQAMDRMDVIKMAIPGLGGPLTCLSFPAEIRLMNATLDHLLAQIDGLTAQLLQGAVIEIPRTVLFNVPTNVTERIHGLLMRCLLSINKARQLHALMSDVPAPAEALLAKLHSHPYCLSFAQALRQWLANTRHTCQHQVSKWAFINSLLGILTQPDDYTQRISS